MADPVVDALILELLEWLADGERTYEETIDIWRTFCPRLPVWEEAKDRGLVAQENLNGREIVRIAPAGFAFLQQRKTSLRPVTTRPTGVHPLPRLPGVPGRASIREMGNVAGHPEHEPSSFQKLCRNLSPVRPPAVAGAFTASGAQGVER
jgi:hypothetical protein